MNTDPSLRREEYGWYSERLGAPMPVIRYGHWGKPVLLFPTGTADYLDNERNGLIRALEPHLFAGKLNVFSCNTVSGVWLDDGVPFHARSDIQSRYSAYVEEELVPHLRRVVQDSGARFAVAGASFGAYLAANAFFRRPDLFDTLIGMSGFYELRRSVGEWSDHNLYFNTPLWFVDQMPEGPTLDALRAHAKIHLLTGQGAYEYPHETHKLAEVLRRKAIPHNLEVWGHDIPHEWWTWHKMWDVLLRDRLYW